MCEYGLQIPIPVRTRSHAQTSEARHALVRRQAVASRRLSRAHRLRNPQLGTFARPLETRAHRNLFRCLLYTSYLAILATLLGCQGADEFRIQLGRALDAGLTPVQAKEVVHQAVDYLGIGRVRPFLAITNEVLEARGVALRCV